MENIMKTIDNKIDVENEYSIIIPHSSLTILKITSCHIKSAMRESTTPFGIKKGALKRFLKYSNFKDLAICYKIYETGENRDHPVEIGQFNENGILVINNPAVKSYKFIFFINDLPNIPKSGYFYLDTDMYVYGDKPLSSKIINSALTVDDIVTQLKEESKNESPEEKLDSARRPMSKNNSKTDLFNILQMPLKSPHMSQANSPYMNSPNDQLANAKLIYDVIKSNHDNLSIHKIIPENHNDE